MTHVLGPVPLDANDYVPRQFENRAKALLLKREWVLILGPRQHGKTSALIRIQAEMTENGYQCAFVDMQAAPPAASFRDLLQWFAREVAKSLGNNFSTPAADQEDQIESWLEAAIDREKGPPIILVDEVSAVRDREIRNSFFGQIRALKTAGAMANGSPLGGLLFVFAGTFRQEALVAELNSPFNVSIRLETEDLTFDQVKSLVDKVLQDYEGIAEQIYEWAGGQPHLVQHMLSVLEDSANAYSARLNEEVERLRREGSDHLDGVFRLVFEDQMLTKLASGAAANGYAENDAANADSKYMIAVGLMKRDGNRLIFRNGLYKLLAEASPQLRPEQFKPAGPQHFITLSDDAFQFILDDELREIALAAHNGAVIAYNGGAYRLAIIGFGVALEAMLIAWLAQQSSQSVANAVIAAKSMQGNGKASFIQHEHEADPGTWRLVNLMRVGRQMQGVKSPASLPDSLREMRNFAHPTKIKASYMKEDRLQPEAQYVGAFISAIKRDLT